MTAVPRAELLEVLASVAVIPRYTLRTEPDGPGWSTVRELCAAGATTDQLIDTVARRFAIGTPRVAGSFTVFGYASRLLGPVVTALATRGVLLDVHPDRVRWRYEPTDGFQFLLTEPAGRRAPDDRAVDLWWADLIDGHLRPVVEAVRERAPGAAGMLWGNVAASVAGALDTVARHGLTPVVDCGPLLDHGPLAGAGTFTAHRGRSCYVRRSCCLHYQIPAGGKCGDCALLTPAELRQRWDASLEAWGTTGGAVLVAATRRIARREKGWRPGRSGPETGPMTALPGHSLSRPTPHDVADILVMLHASDVASIGAPEFDESQVRDILTAPDFDPALDAWLVRDHDGRVACLGYLEPEENSVFCEVYRHPDSVGDAHGPVLDLLLARCAERARAAGRSELVVRAGGVPGTEEWWLTALAGAGFAFEYQSARMSRQLTGTEQVPTPPAGVVVRPMAAGELDEFHAVMVEAFATARRPYTADDSGQWDDCLVCEVDGEWAAALRSTDQRADRDEGWVKLLGVRPAHRGRGLGRLLLETAFAGHAARGRTATGLGVDTSNPTGAYQLYQSVGMTTAYAANICQLTLRP